MSNRLGIKERQAVHGTQALALLAIKVSHTKNKVFLLDI
jgi:hypothetical protein